MRGVRTGLLANNWRSNRWWRACWHSVGRRHPHVRGRPDRGGAGGGASFVRDIGHQVAIARRCAAVRDWRHARSLKRQALIPACWVHLMSAAVGIVAAAGILSVVGSDLRRPGVGRPRTCNDRGGPQVISAHGAACQRRPDSVSCLSTTVIIDSVRPIRICKLLILYCQRCRGALHLIAPAATDAVPPLHPNHRRSTLPSLTPSVRASSACSSSSTASPNPQPTLCART